MSGEQQPEQKPARLAALWALARSNPRVSAAVAVFVVVLVAGLFGRNYVLKVWSSSASTISSSQASGAEAVSSTARTSDQYVSTLREQVGDLKKTESRYKKLMAATNPMTGEPLFDKAGNPIFNVDQGDTATEERLAELKEELVQREEIIEELQKRIQTYEHGSSFSSSTATASKEESRVAPGSRWIVGADISPDFGGWAVLGIRGPLTPSVDLGGKVVIPAFGPALEQGFFSGSKVGFEIGF